MLYIYIYTLLKFSLHVTNTSQTRHKHVTNTSQTRHKHVTNTSHNNIAGILWKFNTSHTSQKLL